MTLPVEKRLALIAAKVCWFKPPSETLTNQDDFLCRVMQWATWEDAEFVRAVTGESRFREALGHAPAGILDPRSWTYWTGRLGLSLPARTRQFPNDAPTLQPA